VEIVHHDLSLPLPETGFFDAVVSSFAIHHVDDGRKRALYAEVFERLVPGGTFLNLEHVASPTEHLHNEFLASLDIEPADDDPSNQLAPVEPQLGWLREIGFDDVDCTGSGGSWPWAASGRRRPVRRDRPPSRRGGRPRSGRAAVSTSTATSSFPTGPVSSLSTRSGGKPQQDVR